MGIMGHTTNAYLFGVKTPVWCFECKDALQQSAKLRCLSKLLPDLAAKGATGSDKRSCAVERMHHCTTLLCGTGTVTAA